MFSCDFSKISPENVYAEHLRMTTSSVASIKEKHIRYSIWTFIIIIIIFYYSTFVFHIFQVFIPSTKWTHFRSFVAEKVQFDTLKYRNYIFGNKLTVHLKGRNQNLGQ